MVTTLTNKPSRTDLWLYANRSYAFLRDENMKMQLYFRGNGEMEVVPCPRSNRKLMKPGSNV
jgi:hypothetical protein